MQHCLPASAVYIAARVTGCRRGATPYALPCSSHQRRQYTAPALAPTAIIRQDIEEAEAAGHGHGGHGSAHSGAPAVTPRSASASRRASSAGGCGWGLDGDPVDMSAAVQQQCVHTECACACGPVCCIDRTLTAVAAPRPVPPTLLCPPPPAGGATSPLLLTASASTSAQTMRIRQINHEAQRNDRSGRGCAAVPTGDRLCSLQRPWP